MSETEAFVYSLFSKPVYGRILNIDTKKIVSILEEYDFHEAGRKGTDTQNDADNICSRSDSLYVLEDKRFKFLKDELMKEFYLFALDVMRYSNKFEITTSWFTKSTKGQSSNYHNHNNCILSGILYLQTNENSGNISFEDFSNKRYLIQPKEFNLLNSQEWKIKPEDGLLLMFPSEVYHKIQKNESDITRYSLAFNLVPTGAIGYGDSQQYHLNIKKEA